MLRNKEYIIEIIETFVLSIIIILTLYLFIASIEIVSGESMEPNFFTGERILVDKVTKHFDDFNRGDIVVLLPPNNPELHYIKRIIGVPGDIIKIFECKLYISRDGKKYVLQEEYLREGTCTVEGPVLAEGRSIRIGDEDYLVLGDNRNESQDSRYFGMVAKKHILGRVVFRFWPLNRLGFIR